MPSSDDGMTRFAVAAMRLLLPDANWRLAQLDGVRVIFAPVREVAECARAELLKIENEDNNNPPKETT